MGVVTRVNGLKATANTLYSVNSNLYKITVKKTAGGVAAIDLRGEDDAVDEVVEMIVKDLNPSAYFVVNDSSGVIYVVLDKANTSAAELQIRVRRIGIDPGATTTSIGPNDIDISSTTVEAAVSMTFGV
jgi:hypothetical protein